MAWLGAAWFGKVGLGAAGLGLVMLFSAPGAAVAPSQPSPIPDVAFQSVVVAPTIHDVFPIPTMGPRPAGHSPVAIPIVEKVPRARARVNRTVGLLRGTASWYCLPGVSACMAAHPTGGMYAAAGPTLRQAMGDWRGKTVQVCGNGSCVSVVLADWCSCGGGYAIDLYSDAFKQLAPLSSGVIKVDVRW